MKALILDAFLDSLAMLPFLFVIYFLVELLEFKYGSGLRSKVAHTGKWGPFVGSLMGCFPQCGFSGRVIEILNSCGVKFNSKNVLEDPNLRDGIKQFSNWPTIPQLYVKGEFVGGCDIVNDLYTKGELKNILES